MVMVSKKLALSLLLVVGVASSGCQTAPEEEVSPTQWLLENSSIIRDLESFEKDKQQSAVARLRALGPLRGRAVALTVLREAKADYRAEVILARLLADWKEPEAVPRLLHYLKHEDRGAAELAREGILVFGDDPFVRKSLFELVRHSEPGTRLVAAEVLLGIQDRDVFDFCAKIYHSEPDRFVRGAFVAKFLSGKHPRRQDFLIEALSDPDVAIRELAWSGLLRQSGSAKARFTRIDYRPDASPAERAKAIARLKTER